MTGVGSLRRLEEKRVPLRQGLAFLDLQGERERVEPGNGVERCRGLFKGEAVRELRALEASRSQVLQDEERLGRLGAVVRMDTAWNRQLDFSRRLDAVLALEHLEIRHDLERPFSYNIFLRFTSGIGKRIKLYFQRIGISGTVVWETLRCIFGHYRILIFFYKSIIIIEEKLEKVEVSRRSYIIKIISIYSKNLKYI